MNETSVNDGVLSDGEKRRLLALRRQAREIVSTVTNRIEITIDSLEASRRRFEEARANSFRAMGSYHEALIALAESDDDDFAIALEKAEKFERIESEYLASGE